MAKVESKKKTSVVNEISDIDIKNSETKGDEIIQDSVAISADTAPKKSLKNKENKKNSKDIKPLANKDKKTATQSVKNKPVKEQSKSSKNVNKKQSISKKDEPIVTIENFVIQKLDNAEKSVNDKQTSQNLEETFDKTEILHKFKKKKTAIPTLESIDRYSPDLKEGLSTKQVNNRFTQFLFNDTNQKYSKSITSIFLGNIFTFFNLLGFLVATALIYSHAPIGQLFFVIIFCANIIIGIVEEIFAKVKIDKLSVLSAPTAKVVRNGVTCDISVKEIVLDDVITLSVGQQVPADCLLAEGYAEVNESLLTGESIPVKKEIGDVIYAGSFISSGSCLARVDKVGKFTYLNSLTSKAKKYKRPNSELMNSTMLFIKVISILIIPVAIFSFIINYRVLNGSPETVNAINESIQATAAVIIGMIPSGMMLLTSAALAIGVIRLAKHNTLVQDLYSLEMLARVNVLCLDKTGTITDGRMKVSDCMILNNYTKYSINEIVGSMLNSLSDNNQTSIALYNHFGYSNVIKPITTLPFSSKRKLSAVTFEEAGTFILGAPEFVLKEMPEKINRIVSEYATMGLRVLAIAHSNGAIVADKLPAQRKIIALITIADNIREDAVQTIRWFKENDVAVKVISGDNPVTVAEVARRVGIENADKFISLEGLSEKEVAAVANKYTVFGRVTPEQKAILVKSIKANRNTVAMTGDGVNDILALKEADCAISVASGSEAARNVSHLVLMDNNFSSMPKIVNEGRRVINNIKKTASLYTMKTLYTAMLALIFIAMQNVYPFTTSNMLLLEFFVIGIPSFFLALQPNNNRVKGKFMSYVLSRSLPGAVIMVLCVMAMYVCNLLIPDYFGGYWNAMAMILLTFGGLVMLYRICQPLNVTRFFVWFGMLAFILLAYTIGNIPILSFIPEILYAGWSEIAWDWTHILIMVCVVQLLFPLSKGLIGIIDKIKFSEDDKK